jgi:hypothetical protein
MVLLGGISNNTAALQSSSFAHQNIITRSLGASKTVAAACDN